MPMHSPSTVRRAASALALLCSLVVLLGPAGCVSKSKARTDALAATVAAQQQSMALLGQQQGPSVQVRGPVRNPIVPWTEELTLAQAIVAAEYTGFARPRLIIITRGGQVYRMSGLTLLRGREDPLLEPGDVIELK